MKPNPNYLGDTKNTTPANQPGNCPPKGNLYGEIEPLIFTASRHAKEQVWAIQPRAVELGWKLPELTLCESIGGIHSLIMLIDEREAIGAVTARSIELKREGFPSLFFYRWNAAKWAIHERLQKMRAEVAL